MTDFNNQVNTFDVASSLHKEIVTFKKPVAIHDSSVPERERLLLRLRKLQEQHRQLTCQEHSLSSTVDSLRIMLSKVDRERTEELELLKEEN